MWSSGMFMFISIKSKLVLIVVGNYANNITIVVFPTSINNKSFIFYLIVCYLFFIY